MNINILNQIDRRHTTHVETSVDTMRADLPDTITLSDGKSLIHRDAQPSEHSRNSSPKKVGALEDTYGANYAGFIRHTLKSGYPSPEKVGAEEDAMKWKLAQQCNSGSYWLSTSNPKTIKGIKDNYITAVLSLAPATYSGITTCFRFKHCHTTCLFHQGRGRMKNVKDARIKKTKLLYKDMNQAALEIHAEIRRMNRLIRQADLNTKLAVRLNCFSDIKWEELQFESLAGKTIIDANPEVQFYDYTKYTYSTRKAWKNMPINYHLTYSYDGTPEDNDNALQILNAGKNVMVVLSKEYWKEFPELKSQEGLLTGYQRARIARNSKKLGRGHFIELCNYHLHNGELTDNRFLDPSPVVLLGLEKGHSHISI
jgi:hypothetical protein